jgi:hypothetical protein
MLRELADLTGLLARVTAALADTYQRPWTHAPGAVFAHPAATVDDGADCTDGVDQRRALQDPPVANVRAEFVRVEADVLVWSRITVVSGRLGTTVTSAGSRRRRSIVTRW